MPKARFPSDRYLLLLLVVCFIYAAYWVNFGYFRYITYNSIYYDIGLETYSSYWHLHGNNTSILQFFVVSNHLSPLRVMLLPIFALYQQPVTLLAIQEAFLALTAVVVYIVSKDLLKSPGIGFAFAIAFLVNPGVGGLLIDDVHSEAFLPLFFILSFYFYLKNRKGYFLLSYVMLLSVMEEAPIVGLTLLLALFIYELRYGTGHGMLYKSERKEKFRLLGYALALSVLSMSLYWEASNLLLRSYTHTPYSEIPPLLQYGIWYKNYIASSIATGIGPYSIADFLTGIAIITLGFGVTPLADPLLGIILYSPWLVIALFFPATPSLSLYGEYYGFTIGGSYVAAVLGFLIISRSKRNMPFLQIFKSDNGSFASAFIVSVSVVLSLALFSGLPYSLYLGASISRTVPVQLNEILASMPPNSSVMTQMNIVPHLFYMRRIETIQPHFYNASMPFVNGLNPLSLPYWFKPDYIIVDREITYYNHELNSSIPNLVNYTADNYTLYYNQSGIMVFRAIT